MVPGRETDQGKSQEVGRAWEMAKEGRGGLPRAFCCFVGWGGADGTVERIRDRVSDG